MLLVLVHALKKDLNLVVLDVDLSRQLLELGLLALYCFLLVLHFEALFVLLVLDLGDLLLNELDDLVLVFELLSCLRKAILCFAKFLLHLLKVVLQILQLTLCFLTFGSGFLILLIFLL